MQSATPDHPKPNNQRKKLRDACNYCALSKVRCQSQKPTCDRCREKGLNCLYGPSNRKGRPVSKRPGNDIISPRITPTPEISPKIKAVPSENYYDPSNDWTAATWDINFSDTLSNESIWEHWLLQDQASSPYNSPRRSAASSLGPEFEPTGIPPLHIDLSYCTNTPNVSSSSQSSSSDDDNIRTCITEAFSALFPLHDRSQQIHPITTPATNLNGSQPSSDIVFQAARTATLTLTRLLSCTCSVCVSDHSMPLLLVAVAAKILKWYRNLYLSGIENSKSMSPATSPSVIALPLSIGSLDLPRTTEMRMKAQMLLCELEPLVQACGVFGEKLCNGSMGSGGVLVREVYEKYLREGIMELQQLLEMMCGKRD